MLLSTPEASMSDGVRHHRHCRPLDTSHIDERFIGCLVYVYELLTMDGVLAATSLHVLSWRFLPVCAMPSNLQLSSNCCRIRINHPSPRHGCCICTDTLISSIGNVLLFQTVIRRSMRYKTASICKSMSRRVQGAEGSQYIVKIAGDSNKKA